VEKEKKKVQVDIRATKARIKQLANEVKELSGPVSAAIRRTLRELGIELTIYWDGTFVRSQIDKLRDRSRYIYLF
jgi:type II secretory pathway component PulM